MKPPTFAERDTILREICHAISDANGGKWPATMTDWERVAARFGVRVLVVPPCILASPILRYDGWYAQGKLYVPRTSDMRLLNLWMTHELAEASMIWEGRAPFCYPGEWGTHHDLARMVERIAA